jgi:hypothetical protein
VRACWAEAHPHRQVLPLLLTLLTLLTLHARVVSVQ